DALVSAGGNRTPAGAGFYPVDIRSRELADVFGEERPEVVSHHAAQANLRRSIDDPAGDADVNVLGTLRVLDLAVRHKARQFIFGDGTQTREFVYVGDVAEANVRVLGRSVAAPVHIATGVETSVNDLAARLVALTGTAVRPTNGLAIPGEVHRIALGIERAE